ncbi:sec-independent protein translocase protein TatB [Neisseria sp. HSC-16F19]|nr:Sec-independent protein translocase protein TatB [Neisseria sp. HSC-16F19]MCP2040553.1 sec-independent protein translocase protein TatB [Neisseria sp. HSC-16F19]
MFELAFSEILLIAVVALIVLGPQRLPQVARTAGYWLGRVQRFVAGVKSDLAAQGGLGELGRAKDELTQAAQQLRQEFGRLEGGIRLDDEADLPPWERLPPQRTPADFGIVDEDLPRSPPPLRHHVSLRRQAMQRRRDMRPRFRPRPQLRVRRHSAPD